MEELHKIARSKQSTITLSAVVEIDASLRLVPKQFVGVALARAIMMAMPEIVPYYKNLSGYLSEFNGEKTPADFIYGVNVYNLTFFSKDRSPELLSSASLSQKTQRDTGAMSGVQGKGIYLKSGRWARG